MILKTIYKEAELHELKDDQTTKAGSISPTSSKLALNKYPINCTFIGPAPCLTLTVHSHNS
jgi:hypothetical protein